MIQERTSPTQIKLGWIPKCWLTVTSVGTGGAQGLVRHSLTCGFRQYIHVCELGSYRPLLCSLCGAPRECPAQVASPLSPVMIPCTLSYQQPKHLRNFATSDLWSYLCHNILEVPGSWLASFAVFTVSKCSSQKFHLQAAWPCFLMISIPWQVA